MAAKEWKAKLGAMQAPQSCWDECWTFCCLEGRIVTADALHCACALTAAVRERGDDPHAVISQRFRLISPLG
jgi:hypothetical protein